MNQKRPDKQDHPLKVIRSASPGLEEWQLRQMVGEVTLGQLVDWVENDAENAGEHRNIE